MNVTITCMFVWLTLHTIRSACTHLSSTQQAADALQEARIHKLVVLKEQADRLALHTSLQHQCLQVTVEGLQVVSPGHTGRPDLQSNVSFICAIHAASADECNAHLGLSLNWTGAEWLLSLPYTLNRTNRLYNTSEISLRRMGNLAATAHLL